MFIKFDNGKGTETVVECRQYRKRPHSKIQNALEITLDDEESSWLLLADSDHWSVAYVMNNEGTTIEKLVGPKRTVGPIC